MGLLLSSYKIDDSMWSYKITNQTYTYLQCINSNSNGSHIYLFQVKVEDFISSISLSLKFESPNLSIQTY